MKTKRGAERRDSSVSVGQEQDPLERRRLQNRVSQRNHRESDLAWIHKLKMIRIPRTGRKIRDRIAKLQERVVANELRAAAVLNGWDQLYSPPLPTSNNSFALGSNEWTPSNVTSPLSDSSLLAGPPFDCESQFWPVWSDSTSHFAPSTSAWDSSIISLIPGPSSGEEGRCTPGSNPLATQRTSSVFETCASWQAMPDGQSLENSCLMPSPSAIASSNSPLYYTVNEHALPQILKSLSTACPQSQIIVVVSPEQASQNTPGFSSSHWSLPTSGLTSHFEQSVSDPTVSCPCQAQAIPTAANTWMRPDPLFESHSVFGPVEPLQLFEPRK
ncbi:hypothetical protein N7539_002207 [Penicillium diatomitis]|uniref:BZIP domain-containing protein n=1 Tax=Penicillium diatomitis TaxID=2819901 RepID=A0A9W9XI70_9EURO|nr:uncharacterized protein N7539_002207 [Penicillium diatomitis]KAJ5493461.1 hypothetical protein N7539_002207 [Penicillium diatomitis]